MTSGRRSFLQAAIGGVAAACLPPLAFAGELVLGRETGSVLYTDRPLTPVQVEQLRIHWERRLAPNCLFGCCVNAAGEAA